MSAPRSTVSEYSAGGVVFRRTGQSYDIVAVNRARHTDWSLPKGHIEAGESREQAAIREVKEETGIDARILQPITEVVYYYRRSRDLLVHKTVYHYLLEALNETLGGPNWEVSEARWVPIAEAHTLLSYENDRNVVRKAMEILQT